MAKEVNQKTKKEILAKIAHKTGQYYEKSVNKKESEQAEGLLNEI